LFSHKFFAASLILIVAFLFLQIISTAAIAADKKLPRSWGPFVLGSSPREVKKDLKSFKCKKPISSALECRLLGYPERDDFIVLKFYRKKLVSAAEYRARADWEKTLAKVKTQLGKPTLPAYQSNRVLAYIWQDKRTHITLTHLIKTGYVIYEIRDRKEEPLYRRSVNIIGGQ